MDKPISKFMTPSPHTVGREQTISKAAALMEEHNIRHLPVLHGGQLVGVVSLRDIEVIGSLKGVNRDTTPVEEAMTMDPDVFSESTSLKEVVNHLVDHAQGAALIKRGKEVVGVFTAVDALRVLRDMMEVQP